VVSNPPYWRAGDGHLPDDEERRVACHELRVDLDGWVGLAAALLSPRRGHLCAVFPARRLAELARALERHGLGATSLRFVHPLAGADAELVLAEARPGSGRPVAVEPPLVLKGADYADTDAARAVYCGRFSDALAALPDRRQAAQVS
jgi:tRNA1Val (adenine37-N6)-methyltransferase